MSSKAASAFLVHAESGDLEGVRHFLDGGGDPNYQARPNNITALLLAIKEGHVEVVKELLERGASVNCRTKYGMSCLHAVALTGYDLVLDVLMDYGIEEMDPLWHCRYTPLFIAGQENQVKVAEKLLLYGANPVVDVEMESVRMLPSDVAAALGHSDILCLLLLWCHRLGPFTEEKVQRLPAHSPEAAETLHSSIMDRPENVALMAQKRELDSSEMISDSSLKNFIEATRCGNLAAMTDYTDVNNVNASTGAGLSALHWACLRGQSIAVHFLLGHGALVNMKTETGFTPLYLAAQGGHQDIVEVLMKAGADANMGPKCGIAPLGIALSHRHRGVVDVILARSPTAPPLCGRDNLHLISHPDGMLLQAAERGDLEEVKRCIDIMGMDPNKVTSIQGVKAVHLSCQLGHTDILNELLIRGAGLHYRTKRGHEPIHSAAFGGHVDILDILLNHGSSVNSQTESGMTPLYLASQENNVDFAEQLLHNGADPVISAKGGFTCEAVAVKNHHVDILNLLLFWCHRLGPFSELAEGIDMMCYSEERAEKLQSTFLAYIGEVAMTQQIEEFDLIHKVASDNARCVLEEALQGNTDYLTTQLSYLDAPITSAKLSALHCAGFGGHVETVNYLLDNGADINRQTKEGFTTLYLAAQQGRLDVVKCLLESGAEASIHPKLGLTALGVAMYTRQQDVIAALWEHSPTLLPISPRGSFFQRRVCVKPQKKRTCAVM